MYHPHTRSRIMQLGRHRHVRNYHGFPPTPIIPTSQLISNGEGIPNIPWNVTCSLTNLFIFDAETVTF